MALRTRQSVLYLPMRVWDAPTRLFHWLIVLLVPASYITAQLGWMDLHVRCGYATLALVLFRLIWGFIGSDTSRFRHFLAGPHAVLHHLSQFRRREPDVQVGHNAAGGWMVVLLLALLAVEVGSGLFANDGLGIIAGPLAGYVGERTSDLLSVVHTLNVNILLAAIGVHIVAVVLYAVVKRQNLVRPMITGKKRLPAATRAPHMANPLLALIVLAVAVAFVVVLATRL